MEAFATTKCLLQQKKKYYSAIASTQKLMIFQTLKNIYVPFLSTKEIMCVWVTSQEQRLTI